MQLQMHSCLWMILKCHRNCDCNDYKLVWMRLPQHNLHWHFICYISMWGLKKKNDLQEFSQNVEAYCYMVEINNNVLKIYPFYLLTLWPGYLSWYSDWLRAGRSGVESRWGREFSPVQTGPGAHPVSCKMGTGSFPGVKCGRGVLLTTHPLLVPPRSWKSRAIPLPTLWATPDL